MAALFCLQSKSIIFLTFNFWAPPAHLPQVYVRGIALSAAILLAAGPICKPAGASSGRLLN